MTLTAEQMQALGLVDDRKDFYFKVENAVIDGYMIYDEELGREVLVDYFSSIYEKMVFIVLSRHANNNSGIAWPSISTIAKEAKCGVTAVKKCIKDLEKKNYITKINRPKGNGDNDTNVYSVKNLETLSSSPKENSSSLPRSCDDGGGSPGVQKEEQKKKNYKKNHDSNMHANDLDIFENLFKEFNISFTFKNQEAVKKLLKTMKQQQVIEYLVDTFNKLSANSNVKNLAALFSEKISRGERQVTSADMASIASKEKQIEQQKKEEKKEIEDENKFISKFEKLPPGERAAIENEACEKYLKATGADIRLLSTMKNLNKHMYYNSLRTYITEIMRM